MSTSTPVTQAASAITTQPAPTAAKKLVASHKRFCEAKHLEKQWANERLGWLFTPQSILFAFFGLTFTEIDAPASQTLRWLIAILGGCLSGLVLASVWAAARMHLFWTQKAREVAQAYEALPNGDSLTFGTGRQWPAQVSRLSAVGIPVLFLIIWAFVAAFLWTGQLGVPEIKPSSLKIEFTPPGL